MLQDETITEEMKSHAVLAALHAGNEIPEVVSFLKVDKRLVYKVKRGLGVSGGDVQSVTKREKKTYTIRCHQKR